MKIKKGRRHTSVFYDGPDGDRHVLITAIHLGRGRYYIRELGLILINLAWIPESLLIIPRDTGAPCGP